VSIDKLEGSPHIFFMMKVHAYCQEHQKSSRRPASALRRGFVDGALSLGLLVFAVYNSKRGVNVVGEQTAKWAIAGDVARIGGDMRRAMASIKPETHDRKI